MEHHQPHPPTPTKPVVPYDGTFAVPQFRLYLPPTLEKALVERVPRSSTRFDQYRWILSTITFLRYTDRRYQRADFVQLHYETLRKMVSKRHLTSMLDDLCRWQMVERRGSYSPGVYSMGYRLGAQYRSDRVKGKPLHDARLIRKLMRFVAEREARAQAYGPGYAAVHRWLTHVKIDGPRARKYLRRQHHFGSDDYNARLIAIDMLEKGLFFFVVDSTAGRAHHNISNLASDLRRFITVDGEPLVQVDIANSQPLFLHLSISSNVGLETEERDLMETLVLSGRLYDVLKAPDQDRDEFKREMFRDVLFGRGTYSTPTTEAFSTMFPGYADAIAALKVPDYSAVAVTMQTLEAGIIYKAVEAFTRRTNDAAPVLTIHDSLVTTAAYAHIADQVLKETFISQYRIEPTLRAGLL